MRISYVGLRISCSRNFYINGYVTCSCSSDIAFSSIAWYHTAYNSTEPNLIRKSMYSVGSIGIHATTDNYGDIYTCSMSNDCGGQQKSVTVDFTGMNRLAS